MSHNAKVEIRLKDKTTDSFDMAVEGETTVDDLCIQASNAAYDICKEKNKDFSSVRIEVMHYLN